MLKAYKRKALAGAGAFFVCDEIVCAIVCGGGGAYNEDKLRHKPKGGTGNDQRADHRPCKERQRHQ